MKTRLALYARVSSSEQTLDCQLEALREYAERRGVEVYAEYAEYADVISGAKDRRPDLDELMVAARRRRIDAVAVTKVDRLGRSVRHLTTLVGELEALGVDLIVLDQSIDTTTPEGRLLFHNLAAIAEFERDLIRERTLEGMHRAKKEGVRLGRPGAVVPRLQLRRGLEQGKMISEITKSIGVSRATIRARIAELGGPSEAGATLRRC